VSSTTDVRVGITDVVGWAATFDAIAAGERERERTGSAPFAQVRMLAEQGYGRLRLPVELGGAGLSVEEVIELTVDLAAADSNVAHIWRNHLLFVESVRADPELYRPWLSDLHDGFVFGLGFGETGMPRAGLQDFTTTLTRREGGWVLDGVKFYSTGNLYADRIVVQAATDDGVAHAIVPADRAGIVRLDDWDGIGQRFTGSGTTRFDRVAVRDDEVIAPERLDRPGRRPSPLAQLYLSAVVAGITAAAAREAVTLVQGRGRNYFHGLAEEPRHDPLLQETVGQLSADAFAARAVVVAAARTLDLAVSDGGVPAMEAASLDAARAKATVDRIATRATSGLLDAGSASAVREGTALDRFWRNARTVIAHNPASYKLRVLGEHLLNGTPPPEGSFF